MFERIGGRPSLLQLLNHFYADVRQARHIPLGLREEHFKAWLGLWDINCHIWLSPDCADEISALALQIGQRLRQFCGVRQSLSFLRELHLPQSKNHEADSFL